MSTQEFIIKLIKLLKPEFYNKITWAVVISGLVLMATPFWEEILLAVLKKEYELDLAPGGNIPWGFALVVIGLLYHLTSNSLLQFIEYKDREKSVSNRVKHDSDIFKASQEILGEKFLTNFFEWLLSDHSYCTNDSSKLHEYAEYHHFPENHYIDTELQDAALKMSKALNQLLHWMSLNFWVFPEKQTGENMRLCMHPHWNVDRGGHGEPDNFKKYDEATDKLSNLSEEVKSTYRVYRGLVKKKLFI
ncbi:hypothetical protein [Nitrosomonas communis]|uniref:hypothetical protein n=1 Tax=Nitrosomonas communis TaxID=44574 RepID=UPI0026F22931|nr:hypothetical protein [Nitrosomonas communis]MCO6427031.1 hypothetical protein [Nitrosomonas communis]